MQKGWCHNSSRCIHTSSDGTTECSSEGEKLGSLEGKKLGSFEGGSDGFGGKGDVSGIVSVMKFNNDKNATISNRETDLVARNY